MPAKIILFNKPYQVLTQFSDADDRETLKDYIEMPGIYPAGRLDRDSEGLLLLTNDGEIQHILSHPKFGKVKTYWVEVENVPSPNALNTLRKGVELKDGLTKPATIKLIEPPNVWPRNPPVRFRKDIPTQWLEMSISEGKNRQVRRMTAAVGHPTLRLIRVAIGDYKLSDLQPGQWKEVPVTGIVKRKNDTNKTNNKTRSSRIKERSRNISRGKSGKKHQSGNK